MSRDFDSEERLLSAIADAVVRVVKESPRDAFAREIGMGADGTPTKHVDKLAEDEVLRLVREMTEPRWNVVSEECGFLDHGSDVTLVVDPIDGTTNAARDLPLYCIGLALGSNRLSDVHHAFVRNIPTGDTYTARKGGGAFKNGRPIRVRSPRTGDAIVSTDLDTPQASQGIQKTAERAAVRSFGSATLEMCFVADGGLDLYYMATPKLRVTDIAPSTLIVREAGGVVLDADGKDLDMDLTLAPRVSVIAAPDREALELVEAFR